MLCGTVIHFVPSGLKRIPHRPSWGAIRKEGSALAPKHSDPTRSAAACSVTGSLEDYFHTLASSPKPYLAYSDYFAARFIRAADRPWKNLENTRYTGRIPFSGGMMDWNVPKSAPSRAAARRNALELLDSASMRRLPRIAAVFHECRGHPLTIVRIDSRDGNQALHHSFLYFGHRSGTVRGVFDDLRVANIWVGSRFRTENLLVNSGPQLARS
jgi:hypothetical protein